MFDQKVVEEIVEKAGLEPTEENIEAVSGLLLETLKLGIFNMDTFSEETIEGLIPFVRSYVEEIVRYGKDPYRYAQTVMKRLKEMKNETRSS